jgi:multidrug efflux pump subunit AcrA (membrane-fusion protein)
VVVAGAVVGVAVLGILLGPVLSRGRASRKQWTMHKVQYEKWQSPIEADGDLEPAETSEIYCRVKARVRGSTIASIIRWVIEDGAIVHKGQLLAQLDDSGLQEDLGTQRIARDQARFDWEQAQADHDILVRQNESDIAAAETAMELARIDLEKYLKGEHPQALDDINNRLEQARDRAAYSERMVKKGSISRSQAENDRLVLEKVQMERHVLEYTRIRTETDLRGKAAEAERALGRIRQQARAKEAQAVQNVLTKKQIYVNLDNQCREIEEEIRKCTLTAPRDGQVVYYVSPQTRHSVGTQQGIVAQGEPVREGQLLIRIPDLRRMQVHVPVHEALVNWVHGDVWQQTGFRESVEAALLTAPDPLSRLVALEAWAEMRPTFHDREQRRVADGLPALIRVNAFPGRVFQGHVKQVAGVSSLLGYRVADVMVYQTLVVFDEEFEGLKPDMTAHVTILAEQTPEPVLTVPVEAILSSPETGGRCTCFVATDDGPEERTIVVGAHNEHLAEVRSGLVEGEEVILEPESVRREGGQEKRRGDESAEE